MPTTHCAAGTETSIDRSPLVAITALSLTDPVDFQASNVAFFPGYPLTISAVKYLGGEAMTIQTAAVLAAQAAAWGFWTYWLLLLARFGVRSTWAVLLTALVALHPAAFFLVVAYSESLFLFALMGFLFWVTARAREGWIAAAAHGLLMTATRIGGVPVAFCPLAARLLADACPAGWQTLRAVRGDALHRAARVRRLTTSIVGAMRRDGSRLATLALVGTVASLGAALFFAYCQWRFGSWDLYMQTQQAGWNVHADWLWWARPVNYAFLGSTWHPNVLWPDDVSRFCVIATIALLVVLFRLEWRLARHGNSQLQGRVVFYLAALALFWLHATGASPILMKSMLRYCFCVHILLLAAVGHLLSTLPHSAHLPRRAAGWAAAGLVLSATLQVLLAWRFFSDLWIA